MYTRAFFLVENKEKIMKILCTEVFEQQFKEILQAFLQEDLDTTKRFKMYLETLIINIPTKTQKYKRSIYFNDDNIRDLEHQGFIIPFYVDNESKDFIILGIIKK